MSKVSEVREEIRDEILDELGMMEWCDFDEAREIIGNTIDEFMMEQARDNIAEITERTKSTIKKKVAARKA